jgi:hypothetical protein
MKRIAIQYYGLVRGFKFEKTRDKIYKNLIAPLRDQGFEIDIFWHTYDKEYDSIFETVDKERFPVVSSRVDPDEPIDSYLEHDFKTDQYFTYDPAWTRDHRFGWFKFWNSIKQVSAMRNEYEKENNVSYYSVINTSPQMEPQNAIDDLSSFSNEIMYSPGYAQFGGYYTSFFIGSPEHMNHVARVYDEFITNKLVPRGHKIEAEMIFARQISHFKMYDGLNVRFHRIRFDGEIVDH